MMFREVYAWLVAPDSYRFTFAELGSVLREGDVVEWIQDDNPFYPSPVPNQECSAWMKVPQASIKYVRSRQPKGIIETMDMSLARGTRRMPLFLKYESERCVWYSMSPPFRVLWPINDTRSMFHLSSFGERVRALTREAPE